MKKIYFLAAVATVALASCSNSDEPQAQVKAPETAQQAIGFEAYPMRSVTRAGEVEAMDLAKLKTTGFGVFAFYTDNNDYEPLSQPNFMYNQKVTWNTPVSNQWGYDPIKYWPNEYGSNATSDDADKVSFFAYAPYVEVTPATGKVDAGTDGQDKWGIVAMSRNTASGDPIIKYIASFDQAKSVDLLWGTIPASTTWDLVQTGSPQTLPGEGMPWLNIQRPKEAATQADATQRVKFQFEHALAQLTVKIDADVDAASGTHTNEVDSKTRIWVRSISFTGFATKGALNLNNTTAKTANWLDFGGVSDLANGETVTVFDGLKDGKEGTASNAASNEKMLGFNPQVTQSSADIDNPGLPAAAWKAANKGVTKDAVYLFSKGNAAADAPIMVIPTGDEVTVEIVYDVETIDKNLANYVSDNTTKGSSIENRISQTVKVGSESLKMANGKHYTLNLHLGMNSVKLDAAVTGWVDVAENNVNLPKN